MLLDNCVVKESLSCIKKDGLSFFLPSPPKMPEGLPISIKPVSITVPGGGVLVTTVDPLTGKHHVG